jgi:hypothetical protein
MLCACTETNPSKREIMFWEVRSPVAFTSVAILGLVLWIAWGTWWCSWLRHCATSQKLAGSVPVGVSGIFHWHNPPGSTMALGLTQPLTEMSARNNSWGGKGGWCIGLTTLPPSCADCLEIWNPQGLSRSVMGLLYLYLILWSAFVLPWGSSNMYVVVDVILGLLTEEYWSGTKSCLTLTLQCLN